MTSQLPEGFVRWPLPSDTWAARSSLPTGFRVAVVDENQRAHGCKWTVGAEGRLCRFTVGPGHKTCRQPAAVLLHRHRYGGRRNDWAYCAEHIYGRRIEDGRVLSTILVEVEDDQ